MISPTSDRSSGARVWTAGAICSVMVIGAAMWAFAPLPARSVPSLPESRPTGNERGVVPPPALVALDRGAFGVPIWVIPAPPPPLPPPPAPVAAAPPPPLRLQLLAVIAERAGGDQSVIYKAMVYDPDADKVLVVAAGERIGGGRVGSEGGVIESIDATALRIKDGAGTRVLTLTTEGR